MSASPDNELPRPLEASEEPPARRNGFARYAYREKRIRPAEDEQRLAEGLATFERYTYIERRTQEKAEAGRHQLDRWPDPAPAAEASGPSAVSIDLAQREMHRPKRRWMGKAAALGTLLAIGTALSTGVVQIGSPSPDETKHPEFKARTALRDMTRMVADGRMQVEVSTQVWPHPGEASPAAQRGLYQPLGSLRSPRELLGVMQENQANGRVRLILTPTDASLGTPVCINVTWDLFRHMLLAADALWPQLTTPPARPPAAPADTALCRTPPELQQRELQAAPAPGADLRGFLDVARRHQARQPGFVAKLWTDKAGQPERGGPAR